MAERTGIAWTDATWNPVRGCSRVSEGCRFCFAEKIAARFSDPGMPYHGFADRSRSGSKWTGKVELIPNALSLPLRWRKPRRIFVNSMGDLFHESLSFGQIMRCWDVMWRAPQHSFQVLTKRPERLTKFVADWADYFDYDADFKLARGPDAVRAEHTSLRSRLFADTLDMMGAPPPGCAYPTYDWMGGMRDWPVTTSHIWLGFSAERQTEFDERWAAMRTVAARGWLVFVSAEPLLGPITLPSDFLQYGISVWLIAGGESGGGARPMQRSWAEGLLEQCDRAGVPAFMKQTGSNRGSDWPATITGKGDDPLQWPETLRVQQFPHR